jgi:DNA-directed RNA polymerase subunit RPC12/RpoP
MKCPRCGSATLRKSQDSGSRLFLVVRPFVRPVQCYRCGHEFYRPTALTDELPSAPRYGKYRRAA